MKAKLILLLCLCLLLTACSSGNTTTESSTPDSTSQTFYDGDSQQTEATQPTAPLTSSDQFSDRDLNADSSGSVEILLSGSTASASDKGVSVSGSTVTIISEGKYHLTGSFSGNIVVEVGKTDHVQLILENANITATDTAALFVKQAEKVVVTLEGENSLRTEGAFSENDENNIDGAVFAKDDLTFNGTGSLVVLSPDHGIVCKDDLVFVSGSFAVEAGRHAVSVKDSIRIADGTFALKAGKDCINGENEDDPSASYLYIEKGTFALNAEGDGISVDSTLQIHGGTFTITAGGGSQNGAVHFDSPPGMGGYSSNTASEDTVSTKGMKAGGNVLLYGGTFQIDSADDAVHSNGNVEIYGGSYDIRSGDDGIHGEEQLLIRDGEINISKSYEGLEAHRIDIDGGIIDIVASDDGLNAAGGNDGSGMGWNDMFAVDQDAYISITGGKLTVDASGDGIDSNGALTVSGGETYVSGPTNGGNGTLDYAGEAKVTGGIFVAAGSSGMAMGFGSTSTQGAIFVTYSSQEAGSLVSLVDAAGKEVLHWETTKPSGSIVLSCPEIKQGETYTLTVGSITGEIIMTDILYGTTSGMGGPGGGGRPGGGTPPNGGGGPGGNPPPDGYGGGGGTPPNGG